MWSKAMGDEEMRVYHLIIRTELTVRSHQPIISPPFDTDQRKVYSSLSRKSNEKKVKYILE